jgi:hypothetical protein
MANHCVLIPNKMASKDVDAWVRPAYSGSALDNGNVFTLGGKSALSGYGEVWLATAPTSASATGCWMALEPELPYLTNSDGTRTYNGLGTIQDFYISASQVFTAVKLVAGDIITITAEGLDSATVAAYAVPVLGTFKFAWAAAASTGLSLRYLNTTYIPSADGSIGSGRIVAYSFECISN